MYMILDRYIALRLASRRGYSNPRTPAFARAHPNGLFAMRSKDRIDQRSPTSPCPATPRAPPVQRRFAPTISSLCCSTVSETEREKVRPEKGAKPCLKPSDRMPNRMAMRKMALQASSTWRICHQCLLQTSPICAQRHASDACLFCF